jgi:hypothetical protein
LVLYKKWSFLFNEYGVEVDYAQDNDNAYYHDLSLIEINTRQNFRSRLHTLLHEAGHAALRNGVSPIEFKTRFPFMRDVFSERRVNKFHRIDVLREEVLAWDKGKEIAQMLNIALDEDIWNRHRQEALAAYVEWV